MRVGGHELVLGRNDQLGLGLEVVLTQHRPLLSGLQFGLDQLVAFTGRDRHFQLLLLGLDVALAERTHTEL